MDLGRNYGSRNSVWSIDTIRSCINLVCCWSISALIVYIIFPDWIWLQVIVFIVVSIVLILSTRKLARKLQDTPEVKTNIDGIVGKEGKVTIDILPHEVGEVKVEGKLWTAVADCEIKKDAYIEVLAVDGVKLVVKELDN